MDVRLLGAVTPLDAARERARLVAAFEGGGEAVPRWRYPAIDLTEARSAADALAQKLAGRTDAPLTRLCLARAAELAAEAELAQAIGAPTFGPLARARFATTDAAAREEASVLAKEWLALDAGPALPTLRSDSLDPRALLPRMRAEVRRLGLPFEVVPSDSLAALAAIGDRHIWVTTGRDVTEADTERTIVHELHGHALPRARAGKLTMALFRVGTARGADEQEGLALVLEERGAFLGPRRKRELAGRHLVVETMAAGASFVDAVRALLLARFTPRDAVRMAERAYRGGDGTTAGLGRERVYLESFVRARRHLAGRPEDEPVLCSGQVSLDAVDTLRPFWVSTSSFSPSSPPARR